MSLDYFIFSVSDTGIHVLGKRKYEFYMYQQGTNDLLIASADDVPQSYMYMYRKLMGAKAIKLRSCS